MSLLCDHMQPYPSELTIKNVEKLPAGVHQIKVRLFRNYSDLKSERTVFKRKSKNSLIKESRTHLAAEQAEVH